MVALARILTSQTHVRRMPRSGHSRKAEAGPNEGRPAQVFYWTPIFEFKNCKNLNLHCFEFISAPARALGCCPAWICATGGAAESRPHLPEVEAKERCRPPPSTPRCTPGQRRLHSYCASLPERPKKGASRSCWRPCSESGRDSGLCCKLKTYQRHSHSM